MVEVLRQQGSQLRLFLRRNANYVEDNNGSIPDNQGKIPAVLNIVDLIINQL